MNQIPDDSNTTAASAVQIISDVVAYYKPSGPPLIAALEIFGALKQAGFRIVKVEDADGKA